MTQVKTFDTLALMQKRFNILVGARLKDRTGIDQAVKEIKKLRKKLTAQAKGFNYTAQISKERDSRCTF